MPVNGGTESPEWVRPIRAAVASSGYRACKIASYSECVVKEFMQVDEGLKGYQLTESTLSRMLNGVHKKSPVRERLIVLMLTILCLADRGHAKWSDEQRKAALAEASEFAQHVLNMAAEAAAQGKRPRLNNHSSLYARTVEQLGAHGEELLRKVEAGSDGEPEAQLALLHQLTGNSDDSYTWSKKASDLNPEFASLGTRQEWFAKARAYAAHYQKSSRPDVASQYLEYAAHAGDGAAAFKLGQMAELEEDQEKALRWYRKADGLGYRKE